VQVALLVRGPRSKHMMTLTHVVSVGACSHSDHQALIGELTSLVLSRRVKHVRPPEYYIDLATINGHIHPHTYIYLYERASDITYTYMREQPQRPHSHTLTYSHTLTHTHTLTHPWTHKRISMQHQSLAPFSSFFVWGRLLLKHGQSLRPSESVWDVASCRYDSW
jgi:hypothetical protein